MRHVEISAGFINYINQNGVKRWSFQTLGQLQLALRVPSDRSRELIHPIRGTGGSGHVWFRYGEHLAYLASIRPFEEWR